MSKKITDYISISAVLTSLMIWEIATRYDPMLLDLLSSPSEIASKIFALYSSGMLLDNLNISLILLISSIMISIILGISLGFISYFCKGFHKVISPFVYLFNSTPIIAFIPIIIVWFGFGAYSKILTILLISTPGIYLSVYNGLNNVEKDYIVFARSFGFSLPRFAYHILFRSSLPFLISGIRVGIGKAVVGLTLSEMYGYGRGIGYLLYLFSNNSDVAGLMSMIFILFGLNVIFIYILNLIERFALRYKRYG